MTPVSHLSRRAAFAQSTVNGCDILTLDGWLFLSDQLPIQHEGRTGLPHQTGLTQEGNSSHGTSPRDGTQLAASTSSICLI